MGEGLGVGLLEAAACGVPLMSINYSAMEDINAKLEGCPLRYHLMRDINTDAERAIPDLDHTVSALENMLSNTDLEEVGKKTRELCEKHYNWDDIAARWIEFLDNVELTGFQGRWGEQIPKPLTIQHQNSTLDRIKNGLYQANRSDLDNSYYIYNLYDKLRLHSAGLEQCGLSIDFIESLLNGLHHEKSIILERMMGTRPIESEDFIRYADIKEVVNL